MKVSVYLTTGNVCEYEVSTEAQAREHADAIIRTGYRSVEKGTPDVLTWWPPHSIVKVKIKLDKASTTKYFDSVVST